MILIPIDTVERQHAIDWFLDAMARGRLTVFDADDMLSQLRLAGDVTNLERVASALSARVAWPGRAPRISNSCCTAG